MSVCPVSFIFSLGSLYLLSGGPSILWPASAWKHLECFLAKYFEKYIYIYIYIYRERERENLPTYR